MAAALAVAIFAAGAVSVVGAQLPEPEDVIFTVEVRTFNVNIAINETDFEDMLPGDEKEMHSFDLVNVGAINALVEGKFLTEDEGTYGLTGGSVIAAENFKINDVALNNNGAAVDLDPAPAEETTPYNATLFVPIGQPDADYGGTVELTFTPEIPEPEPEPETSEEDEIP